LPTNNKFAYPGCKKFWRPRSDEIEEGRFDIVSGVEALLSEEVVEVLEKVVVGWSEVGVCRVWQSFVTELVQLLQGGLCDVGARVVVEKDRPLPVHQSRAHEPQLPVHFVDILTISFSCDGFAWIQKAVTD
uniref:Methyltransf_11 domain-containing protein n=1 Tax=Haemonchus placei TaxID=6290 RepID=A0A0N4VZK2_HAEPC